MPDDRQIDQAFIEIRADLSKLGGDMQKARQIINDATRTSGSGRPTTPAARAYQEALRQTPGTEEYREAQRISNVRAQQNRQTLIQEARDEVEARKRRTEELKAQMEARVRQAAEETQSAVQRAQAIRTQLQMEREQMRNQNKMITQAAGLSMALASAANAMGVFSDQTSKFVRGIQNTSLSLEIVGGITGGRMGGAMVAGGIALQIASVVASAVADAFQRGVHPEQAPREPPKPVNYAELEKFRGARMWGSMAYEPGLINWIYRFFPGYEKGEKEWKRGEAIEAALEARVNLENQATETRTSAEGYIDAHRTQRERTEREVSEMQRLQRELRSQFQKTGDAVLDKRARELDTAIQRTRRDAQEPSTERSAFTAGIVDVYRNAALVGANERYSRSGINPQARTADNTDKMAQLLNEMLNVLKGRNGGVKTAGAVIG